VSNLEAQVEKLTREIHELRSGSFLLRVFTLPKHTEILPSLILKSLEEKAPNFWKWTHAVIAEKSVTAVWDEENVVKRTLEKIKRHQPTIQGK
jgi:glutathione S-transferase